MSTELVDFSWGRPGGAAIRAAGKAGVIRYVPYSFRKGDGSLVTDAGKGLTAAEVRDYRAHDLSITLVFEYYNQRALEGRSAGAFDARRCEQAVQALGLPSGMPFYFAVDWNPTADQWAAVDDYFRGANSELGLARVGAYGGYRTIRHLQAAGLARWWWQTYAWSSGLWAPGVHIRQYNNGEVLGGAKVDLDRALYASYGQWNPPSVPDTSTEAEMALAFNEELWDAKKGAPFYDRPGGTKLGALAGDATLHTYGAPYDSSPDHVDWNWRAARLSTQQVTGTESMWLVYFNRTNDLTNPRQYSPPAPDCSAAVKAATDPLNEQIVTLKDQLAAAAEAQNDAVKAAIQRTKDAAHVVVSFDQ